MHPTPDTVLMLADVRHRELQGDAARIRSARQADASGLQPLGMAAVFHRLRTAPGRAGALLRDGRLRRPDSPRGAEAG